MKETKQNICLTVIVPVYMNYGTIGKTYDQINNLFDNEQDVNIGVEFIFINDGSADDSLNEILELVEIKDNVNVINFSKNFGQVPAIVAGMERSRGDLTLVISADLQDPPELIVEMVNSWKNGAEIMIAYRSNREDDLVSKIASKFFYSMIKKSVPNMPVGGFDFFMMTSKALAEFNSIDERNRFIQGDVLWLGFNVKFLPYKRLKRTIGKSTWTSGKKIKYFIDGFLNTSYISIRLISLLGVLFAIFGFSYSMLIIYNRIINNIPFEGWAPIMMLILIIGGVQMIMIGIIGEYIWRIYDESRGRKQYIVKSTSYDK